MYMCRKIFFLSGIVILISYISYSQSTSSPYSLFAVGKIENCGFGVNQAMGGTGIAFKSDNWLNNINPASYSGIDSMKFIFEVGLFGKYTNFKDSYGSDYKIDGNLRYLAIGMRFAKRWSGSVGIIPVSSVGYSINSSQPIEGLLLESYKTYSGNGGINRIYFGNSLKVTKNLSLGADLSYYFGKISQSETFASNDYFNSYEVNKSYYVNSIHFEYGLQYSFQPRNLQYTLGLTFGKQKTLNETNKASLIVSSDTIELENEKADFYIPMKYGIGLAIVNGKRFKAGIDYELNDWSVIKFSNSMIDTKKSERFSFGIEYLPQKGHRDAGLKLIRYRLGAGYTKSYLIINSTPINSKSVSLGFGIPIRHEMSMINLAFEYGEEGTLKNRLIRERYFMAHFNITLRDEWFAKRKFN